MAPSRRVTPPPTLAHLSFCSCDKHHQYHPNHLKPGENICQMPPSRFADREERLAAEGREKYRGTARIMLEVLYFPRNEPRELDQKNLESLKRCFRKGQCDRVIRNHPPVVIDQSQLDEALQDSKVSAKRLLNNTRPSPQARIPSRNTTPLPPRATPHPGSTRGPTS
ncbi:hypothetical protein B0J14DRAFT_77575 [Halenospora varia]|nr:hypothetical protein B0J14DRAFT_77575 [Halenospora varia]